MAKDIIWEDIKYGAHAVGAGLKAAAPGLAVFGTATAQPEFLAGSAAAAGIGSFLSSLEKGGEVMRTQTARIHKGELIVRPRDSRKVSNYLKATGIPMPKIH
jgi:hypothetical protein